MDLDLRDRVIVVTGGASGIGEAITRACLDEGAIAVVVSRVSENVNRFLKEIHQQSRPCDFFEADLADTEQCRLAVEYVRQKHGRIDGLVNNAGANDGVGLESGNPARFLASLQQNLVHYMRWPTMLCRS